MSDNPKCIDISHWQGFPDFAKVKAAGVIAMIHKASEGISSVDPNRKKNCSAAIKAGIKVCTYHWLKPGDNAAEQMAHFLRTVNPVRSERMVIDYEEDGCTLEQLKVAVQALLDDPRDIQVTVYSGHLLKNQLGTSYDAFLAKNTSLWLAQYTSGAPSWPAGTYAKWSLWQYSESGEVDGIPGTAVDLDRFNGSDEALLRWIGPAVPPPAVEPVVRVALTVPDNVSLVVSINGANIYED